MKKLVTIIAILCVAIMSVSAQKWDLLKPVTLDKVKAFDGAKAGTSAWIPRINAGVSFISLSPTFNELGEFNGFASEPLSKLSIGITNAHYIESDGKAVCNYSYSGLLLLPTTGDTNVALGVAGSLYNISGGFGYHLTKGAFKENWFLMFGVQFVL